MIDACYLKKYPTKFHPDLVWNDEALGFFEECREEQESGRASTV